MTSVMGNRFSNKTCIEPAKANTELILKTNSKLLTVNNIPLNIYLDGFDVLEFLKISKLIELHGGKLSTPNAETVVLSVPGYTVGTNYLRFHINWLHDSIKRNKLQDIGKYILSPPNPRGNNNKVARSRSTQSDRMSDEKDGKISLNVISSLTANQNKTSIIPIREFQQAENNGRTQTNNHNYSGCLYKCANKFSIEIEPPQLTSELMESKIHSTDLRDKPPQLYRMDIPGITYSADEFSVIPVENDDAFPESEIILKANKTEYNTKKLDDHSQLNLKSSNSKIYHWEHTNKSPNIRRLRSKKQMKADKKPKIFYSKREDEKILQYLIEHSAIPKVKGVKVWKDMEASGIIPNRSSASLKLRFMNYLKKDIKQFVGNAEILAEFESLDDTVQ